MTRLTATAFGLDSLPDNDWRHDALCSGHWDMWTEFVTTHPNNTAIARSGHLCRSHCPVFAQCRKWTQTNPPEMGIVQAGQYKVYGRLVEIDDSHVMCSCRPTSVERSCNSPHGSQRRYDAGCRCDVCVETTRVRRQTYWRNRKERELALAGAR